MNDDHLHRLLADAVADIDPDSRLDELRASVRPRPKVVPMARSRSWYAATGIIATAAVIGIVAYATSVASERGTELGPATDPGSAEPSTATATDPAAVPAKPALLPVFYVGHGARGPVLYRQATPVSADLEPLGAAVSRLMAEPRDRDYRRGWKPGWLRSAELSDGVIRVELGSAPSNRPARMSARTAYDVVQSAVYTLQSASHSSARVLFLRSGRPVSTVLGVSAAGPVAPARAGDVLARIGVTRPALDGLGSRRGRLVVAGTTDQALGGVIVRLVRTTGQTVLRSATGLSAGVPDATGRYRWRVILDTSSLSPGSYTIIARNDGRRGDSDTRLVRLR